MMLIFGSQDHENHKLSGLHLYQIKSAFQKDASF